MCNSGAVNQRKTMQHPDEAHKDDAQRDVTENEADSAKASPRGSPVVDTVGARAQQHAPHSLLALIGAGAPDFGSVEQVDKFIRAERQLWNS
jgi:hypothetical protein